MDSPAVIAPPFVARPLRLRPFRALRLVRGRTEAFSPGRLLARPYRDVARRLEQWQQEGHLEQDPDPALYLHEYTVGGITVRGLVGALDLTGGAAGVSPAVLPHEGVHPPQVEELAARMQQLGLNPAPILLVHRGPAEVREQLRSVRHERPTWQFLDRTRQRHRLWRITDPAVLAAMDAALAGDQALVADGHHRYAAYLRLRDSRPGTAWQRGLAMLIDQDDTPLFLGAVHRFIAGVPLTDLETAASGVPGLTVQRMPEGALHALGPDTLVATDGESWTAVSGLGSLRDAAVEVLHRDVLPRLAAEYRVSRHHRVDQALQRAHDLDGVAVLLPSPSLDCVIETSRHRLLPEKATSFQPKPSLGVLMRDLRDENQP